LRWWLCSWWATGFVDRPGGGLAALIGLLSNLLVVLCGDRAAQPVVNAGTLY
jgi:hypothetical protein